MMKFNVNKFDHVMVIVDQHKRESSHQGYKFTDEHGNCIMIVYGEGRRDSFIEYFNNKGDELHLK